MSARTIAIGGAEGLVVLDIVPDPREPPTGHGSDAGVDQRHLPRLGLAVMDVHDIVGHVEGHVGHVQEIVVEIFLDHIALVAAADHELVQAVGGVDLHDVPQDRHPADLDHRLGPDRGLLAEARAESPGQDDDFHATPSFGLPKA
jgi:hypothetical protein